MSSFIFLLFGYNKNVKNLLIFMEYLPRIFWNISVRRMNFMATLEIKDLHVSVKDEESKEEKEILKGVNLKMKTGEIHAIMGPNGTGKSTLSQTIMGHPNYHVTQGDILLDGESIVDMPVDERARKGLFLAMQYPAEIQGVTNAEFLRAAINARRPEDDQISVMDFIKKLDKNLELLDMSQSMTERYLNEGFSGGEKKRNEILQLLMIEPSFAILDEIDSGLDIDALKVVSKGVNSMRGDNFGSLIITHYQRLLNYIVPDMVHVMMGGRIVKTGGPDLAKKLEDEGYAGLRDELGLDIKLVDDED
jgi:FeS assembly ATPase SufC